MGCQRCTVSKLKDGACRIGTQKAQTPTCTLYSKANDERRARKTKTKNDPVPNLTGPYLSTGMKIDQSEDIIFTTIWADVHERSLEAIAHIFVH
jgi:hypothetical protein